MRFLKFVLIFFLVSVFCFVLLASSVYFLFPKVETPVSILILGKGGEGHTAPDLTDVIMFSHLNTQTNKISVISLPRDIWIPAIRAKLNSAYYWDKQNENSELKLTKESILSITGFNPEYYLVVDFSLFKDVINSIGGISVIVDNSFIDQRYPIAGKENDLCNGDRTLSCRYETIEFKEGLTYMDGETALKFVRSRNAVGDEGTDLAREKRQQKIIEALRLKLLSSEVILSPKVLSKLKSVILSHMETNIDFNSGLMLGRFIFENRNNINILSFPDELVGVSQNNPKYDKQYVFLPVSGNWDSFQEWIKTKI